MVSPGQKYNLKKFLSFGEPTDGGATMDSYTTYPSPFLTIDEKSFYTKHYYAGDQRIASRPTGKATFGVLTEAPIIIELRQKQRRDAQVVADTVDLGILNFEEKDIVPWQPLYDVYYFHPDHLGSSTMISDASGYAYQMFLNLPFGETLAEQRRSGQFNNPYKFNGKELDPETGLYYYGARYYDPRLSVFISVDPLAESTMTPYQYTYQNPINLTDPTGMAPESGDDFIDISVNTKNKTLSIHRKRVEGNDVVRLIKDGEIIESYEYGENGSFINDTEVDELRLGSTKMIGATFNDPANFEKADKFYKFAAKSGYEFGHISLVDYNTGDFQSIVLTSVGKSSVPASAYADYLLSMNPNLFWFYGSHSHPNDTPPSGFDKLTLEPNRLLKADRTNFNLFKPKYKGRMPEYLNVYSPFSETEYKYNGEKVIKMKK